MFFFDRAWGNLWTCFKAMPWTASACWLWTTISSAMTSRWRSWDTVLGFWSEFRSSSNSRLTLRPGLLLQFNVSCQFFCLDVLFWIRFLVEAYSQCYNKNITFLRIVTFLWDLISKESHNTLCKCASWLWLIRKHRVCSSISFHFINVSCFLSLFQLALCCCFSFYCSTITLRYTS